MTAAVGLPTLRLVRVRIGPWSLDGLGLGNGGKCRRGWTDERGVVQRARNDQ